MKNYSKRYVVSAYLVFWAMIIGGCGTASIIFGASPIVMRILSNICAWSPTFVLLIGWKYFRPGESRKEFLRRCFSGKITPLLLIFPCLVVIGASILSVLFLSVFEGKMFKEYFDFSTTPILFSTLLSFLSGPTGEELGWRGFLREELNEKYSFWKASIYQGLIWTFWHAPLWIVDSEFLGLDMISYIISNVVVITTIAILMNMILEQQNNLIYTVLIHFSFNIIYTFLISNICFFVILTFVYLIIFMALAKVSKRISN